MSPRDECDAGRAGTKRTVGLELVPLLPGERGILGEGLELLADDFESLLETSGCWLEWLGLGGCLGPGGLEGSVLVAARAIH
jgi:hypothetical protein